MIVNRLEEGIITETKKEFAVYGRLAGYLLMLGYEISHIETEIPKGRKNQRYVFYFEDTKELHDSMKSYYGK